MESERTGLLPTSQQDLSEPQYVERRNYKYYLIWIWRFFIFALVGSSSVKVTRKLLSLVHLTNDTWYYYVTFFFAELLVYTIMIILVGSLLFQWRFFCLVGYKMWSWAMPIRLKTWCYEHLHSHRITV